MSKRKMNRRNMMMSGTAAQAVGFCLRGNRKWLVGVCLSVTVSIFARAALGYRMQEFNGSSTEKRNKDVNTISFLSNYRRAFHQPSTPIRHLDDLLAVGAINLSPTFYGYHSSSSSSSFSSPFPSSTPSSSTSSPTSSLLSPMRSPNFLQISSAHERRNFPPAITQGNLPENSHDEKNNDKNGGMGMIRVISKWPASWLEKSSKNSQKRRHHKSQKKPRKSWNSQKGRHHKSQKKPRKRKQGKEDEDSNSKKNARNRENETEENGQKTRTSEVLNNLEKEFPTSSTLASSRTLTPNVFDPVEKDFALFQRTIVDHMKESIMERSEKVSQIQGVINNELQLDSAHSRKLVNNLQDKIESLRDHAERANLVGNGKMKELLNEFQKRLKQLEGNVRPGVLQRVLKTLVDDFKNIQNTAKIILSATGKMESESAHLKTKDLPKVYDSVERQNTDATKAMKVLGVAGTALQKTTAQNVRKTLE